MYVCIKYYMSKYAAASKVINCKDLILKLKKILSYYNRQIR